MLLMAVPERLTEIIGVIGTISVVDVIDILCVSVLLYYLYCFIRDKRAARLAAGIGLLLAVMVVASLLDMNLVNYILQNIFQVGIIMIVILFQPEIRAMLEQFGTTPIKGIKSISDSGKAQTSQQTMINEVTEAVCDMSESKTGALIVFERSTKLGDIIDTGTTIDALPASFMIKNIFFNKAPMHDGAMIIRDSRIIAAGCLLPLSNDPDIIKDLGTRHRAGIGMSENSDAIVLVVSEETGVISAAVEGKLIRGFNRENLKTFLTARLSGDETGKNKLKILDKVKKKESN